MNHFEIIKKHLKSTNTQAVLFTDYVTELIEKKPYASFLNYIQLMELKLQNQSDFESIQKKTLKGKNQRNYIKYLTSISVDYKYNPIESNVFLEKPEPKTPTKLIEPNENEPEIEPKENKINPLDHIDKNDIPTLLLTLLNLYESEEEKQKVIQELIKKEETKEEVTTAFFFQENFDLNKKMSFQQWVKITDGIQNTAKKNQLSISKKQNQEQIINQFLEKEPKIVALTESQIQGNEYQSKPLEYFTIMTETLAQIYIDQGKYEKAIEAYQSLSLKYPKKNVYFAEQLKKIEQLKNNS